MCEIISSNIAKLQTQHPSALAGISGEFNHASLSATLPTGCQLLPKEIKCCIRSVQEMHTVPLHNLLLARDIIIWALSYIYNSIVKMQPVNKRTVRRWSKAAVETMQGCYEAIDWDDSQVMA